jgi:hypothetical protein
MLAAKKSERGNAIFMCAFSLSVGSKAATIGHAKFPTPSKFSRSILLLQHGCSAEVRKIERAVMLGEAFVPAIGS